MEQKTKGQIESLICEEIIAFEKEYMGRGPTETKAYILKDMIFIRLKGVLSPAEEQLSKKIEGADLIKRTRLLLLETARAMLEKSIHEITGCEIISMHTDISTKTGERILVFTLNRNYEDLLLT